MQIRMIHNGIDRDSLLTPTDARTVDLMLQYSIQLVPLHRGFDDLIEAWPQSREVGWIDQQFDAAGDARLASDQAGALEGEDHLVN